MQSTNKKTVGLGNKFKHIFLALHDVVNIIFYLPYFPSKEPGCHAMLICYAVSILLKAILNLVGKAWGLCRIYVVKYKQQWLGISFWVWNINSQIKSSIDLYGCDGILLFIYIYFFFLWNYIGQPPNLPEQVGSLAISVSHKKYSYSSVQFCVIH